jgi:phage shock protein E
MFAALRALLPFVIPVALLLILVRRTLQAREIRGKLPRLLAEGARIIDVRSPAEFAAGANPKSVNIPLDRLEASLDQLPRDATLLVCCASGMRSGMAERQLRALGYRHVVNAGAWRNTLT